MLQDLKNTNKNRKFYIEEFEKIMANQIKPSKEINLTLGWAYAESVENKNDYLNFYGTVWSKDIAPIVEACRKHGIREFTISNTCSGLTQILADFEELGCKVVGLTKANKGYGNETIPAVKLEVL